MFDWLKKLIVKNVAGTWINKAIRDGVFFVATYLLASDISLCQETSICKDIAAVLGDNAEKIVNSGVEIALFVVAAIMKFKAAKPEAVGKTEIAKKKEES